MNRFTKGKTIGFVTAGLAVVSLFGVGFSAWVVNGNSSNVVADGNVTVSVADVTDERITISNLTLNANGGIKFDAAADDTTGPIVSKKAAEQLSFSITFTLDVPAANSNFKNIEAYMSTDDESDSTKKSAFEDAIGSANNFIVTPVKYESYHTTASSSATELITDGKSLSSDVTSGTEVTLTDKTTNNAFETKCKKTSDGKYFFTVTFNFQWGSAFGGVNPSHVGETDYPESATLKTADEAINALKEMKTFDGIKFNVYLSVSTKSN